MRDLVMAYLAHASERHAATTVNTARKTLLSFMCRMMSHGVTEWADVSSSHVEAWAAASRARGVVRNTVCSYLDRLRNFFRWLVREGVVLVNPIDDELYAGKRERPLILVPDAVAVSSAIDREEVAPCNEQRNRAMMELMYSTGLRRGEVAKLNLRDVLGDEIRVLGKGGKERMVPIGEAVRERLREYIAGERTTLAQRHGHDEEGLFLSRHGGVKLGSAGIWESVRRSMRSEVGPHMLRRACATHMLRNGAPVVLLQKLLGHEKLSTTEIYTKVTPDDLRRELLRHHPGW
jgi:site-specific recombinase XerD